MAELLPERYRRRAVILSTSITRSKGHPGGNGGKETIMANPESADQASAAAAEEKEPAAVPNPEYQDGKPVPPPPPPPPPPPAP